MNNFDFFGFKSELNKILSIGFSNLLFNNTKNSQHITRFIEIIKINNPKTAEAFSKILSESFICNTDKTIIQNLFLGLSNYSTNFVNLHQYKEQTILINRNIARTYFADCVQKLNQPEKEYIATICLWIDQVNESYTKLES